jgi:hypothetical protein
MSARTFDINASKKFGNVKVRNTPDAIVVTLHQTDIVVFDKIKNSVRITSGGWKTPTTKTAINNALSQIEAMTGLSLGRVSAVKGEWFVEQMPFRDGMIYKIKRSTKNNPAKKPKFSESDYYRNSKSKKIRSLSECVEKSMSSRSGGEVDADFIVDVNGQDWQCYTVAIGNREFTLYCYEGSASYVVDSYGSRNTCELVDWEEDEKEAVSRKNPRRRISIEKEVGKFEDFSPKEQAKIIDNYRDINVDHDWYDTEIEDFKNLLEILGFYNVDIQFSGFASQGDGASFTGRFTPAKTQELKKRAKKLKSEAPNVPLYNYTDMKFSEEELEDERVEVERLSSRYSHENTISSDNDDLKEFAKNFSRYIYRQLEAQYDYLTCDDAIKETLEANDYDFDSETFKIY